MPIQVETVQQWNAATSSAVTTIRAIWKILLQIDPNNSAILTWNIHKSNNRLKPLRIDSSFPSSKNKIHEKFVEDFKLSWSYSNLPTEMRIILGHKKEIESYMDNKNACKKLEDMEYEVFVDRIQSERRCIAGYLAGPLLLEITADELADTLIKSKIFLVNKIDQIEIVEKEINIFQGNSKKK